MSPPPDPLAALRDRLLALRSDLRKLLTATETIELAWLATLADVEIVLAALDAEPTR